MTNEQFAALKVGQMVRHKGGKLYKVRYITPAEPIDRFVTWSNDRKGWDIVAIGADAVDMRDRGKDGMFWAARGPLISFGQWQVNEKHPEGRYYQASKEFTADKVDFVDAV